jgi:hypothetical protein
MSFLFCEAQPVVQRLRRRPESTSGIRAGSSKHQIDLSWHVEHLGNLEPVEVFTVEEALDYLEEAIRIALERRAVLANTFQIRTFASMVKELVPGSGLLGYPDAVGCRDRVISLIPDHVYESSRDARWLP